MRKFLLALLLLSTTPAAPAGAEPGQKKKAQCEQAAKVQRNWESIGREYVYFDYILCPAGMDPPNPLVRVWITARGNGYAVEQWAQDRDGADSVSVYHDKKMAYTLYRDLNAIPLKMFAAERRSGVPADAAGQPFLLEGVELIPLKNLAPDAAERARKVFEDADILIKKARDKVPLLHEIRTITGILESLNRPFKAQK